MSLYDGHKISLIVCVVYFIYDFWHIFRKGANNFIQLILQLTLEMMLMIIFMIIINAMYIDITDHADGW